MPLSRRPKQNKTKKKMEHELKENEKQIEVIRWVTWCLLYVECMNHLVVFFFSLSTLRCANHLFAVTSSIRLIYVHTQNMQYFFLLLYMIRRANDEDFFHSHSAFHVWFVQKKPSDFLHTKWINRNAYLCRFASFAFVRTDQEIYTQRRWINIRFYVIHDASDEMRWDEKKKHQTPAKYSYIYIPLIIVYQIKCFRT